VVKWLFISALASIAIGGALGLWSFLAFDRMLKSVYEINQERWTNAGKPIGFLWVPKEAKDCLVQSSLARAKLYALVTSCGYDNLAFGDRGSLYGASLFMRLSFLSAVVSIILCVIFIFF
jgi:hypothetical protein